MQVPILFMCVVCNFLLFFLPALGWYPYQLTDGFFSFFLQRIKEKIRGFLGFKTKKEKTLFSPQQKSCLVVNRA
jgi:hypothetical protein